MKHIQVTEKKMEIVSTLHENVNGRGNLFNINCKTMKEIVASVCKESMDNTTMFDR